MKNDEIFKGATINDEEHQAEMKYDNFIPKGFRTLEKMFDLNEKFRRPANVKTHSSTLQFKLINLGTETAPKFMNLGNVVRQQKETSSSVYLNNTKMSLPRCTKS